jgi:cell wall-associated NlpC family hydrolase
MHQKMTVIGTEVRIERRGRPEEIHAFATAEEADGRARIVDEGLSWVGTPFRNCADIKGRQGGIDCAMLLVRCYVDTGRLAPFDPRVNDEGERVGYPADWMLHRSEERFLGWIEDKLGAHRVDAPRLADVLVYYYGRCYSHGAIMINSEEVVHAYGPARVCLVTRMCSIKLGRATLRGVEFERPRFAFDVWGR